MFKIYTKFTMALDDSKALTFEQLALNPLHHDIRCRAAGLSHRAKAKRHPKLPNEFRQRARLSSTGWICGGTTPLLTC